MTIPLKVELHYDDQWNEVPDCDVRGNPSPDGGLHIRRGRRDWAQRVDFGICQLSLNNRDGKYSPRNPLSSLYGKIGRNTPLRVTVDDENLAEQDRIRFVGEVSQWPQRWVTDAAMWVPIEASGIMRRLGKGAKALESPLRRHYESLGDAVVCYLPLEDGANTDEVENTVQGQHGVAYASGAAPEYPLRPGYGQDDSCPGSAPLPEWPVIEFFGWSRGASVAPHDPPWQVLLSARVPNQGDPVILCEWKANGTYTLWQVGMDASGQVYVTLSDEDEDSPTTQTVTNTDVLVDDGAWRTISVYAAPILDSEGDLTGDIDVRLGVENTRTDDEFTAELGPVRRIRPRPLFPSAPASDHGSVGLGHAAVVTNPDTATNIGNSQAPVRAHAGEPAVGRFVRLTHEAGIAGRTPMQSALVDTFDRTEATGLGTADSGQEWTTDIDGDASVSVSSGEATITANSGSPEVFAGVNLPGQWGGWSLDMELETDTVSVAIQANFSDLDEPVASFGSDRRLPGITIIPGDAVYVGVIQGAGNPELAVAAVAMQVDVRYRLRLDVAGEFIRVALRPAASDDGTTWDLAVSARLLPRPATLDLSWLWLIAGTVTVYSVTVDGYYPSTRLGPQQQATLLDNLQDAAQADGGILHETRYELGLTLRTLGSLYNQDPTAELEYQRGNGSGDVFDPFEPVEDDQALVNDVTARRVDGGAARVRQRTGPLSTQDPPDGVGTYDASVTVNVGGDRQLPDQAGWRVHLGTWDEPRWPHIATNMARLLATGREALAADVAALESGDRLTVDNLPDHLPPGLVDQLAQGYQETLDSYEWLWRANTTPAGPYVVGVYSDDEEEPDPAEPQRYDTAGCETTAAFEAGTDTTLNVETTDGPEWTTDADDLPFDIQASGVRLRVTAVAAGASDTQDLTVDQAPANGVSKTIPAGTDVSLWQPARYAL